jgi:hypothetical protein
MKTRTGFVSNSSSSSFVVVGVPLTKTIEGRLNAVLPKKEGEEEYEWHERISVETGLTILYVERGEAPHLIGKVLADVGSDGDYLASISFTKTQIDEMMGDVIQKLGGGDIEPKLMLGTRPS